MTASPKREAVLENIRLKNEGDGTEVFLYCAQCDCEQPFPRNHVMNKMRGDRKHLKCPVCAFERISVCDDDDATLDDGPVEDDYSEDSMT